jgi:cytochrome c peroxidase
MNPLVLVSAAFLFLLVSHSSPAAPLTPEQQLGKKLFFDSSLSEPAGQACASCHAPETGFSDPAHRIVSPGSVPGRFGNRNAPSAAYAAFSPRFGFDQEEDVYVGGQFLDGRAATLEDQISGPLTNPVEMANSHMTDVLAKVRKASYADRFTEIYGPAALENESEAIHHIVSALAAYERSREFSPFSSKYDAWLAGKAKLTAQEQRGLEIFEAEDKGNCAACHPSRPAKDGTPPLFTDFTYDNLGVPASPDNPFYHQNRHINPDGKSYVDKGLGTPLGDAAQDGKFKVPTLRNIALTAPYMHNGVFTTLEEVADFYNSRDTKKWPAPEVKANVNQDELGDLKLTKPELADLVAFLKTLTDGYQPDVNPVEQKKSVHNHHAPSIQIGASEY